MALKVDKIREIMETMDLVNSLSVKGLISNEDKDALVDVLKSDVTDEIKRYATEKEKAAKPKAKSTQKPAEKKSAKK